MLAREQLSQDVIRARLAALATDFAAGMAGHSLTEIAAFCEVCRQLGTVPEGLADAVIKGVQGRLTQLDDAEVSVLWMLSKGSSSPPYSLIKEVEEALGAILYRAKSDSSLSPEDVPVLLQACADLRLQDAMVLSELTGFVSHYLGELQPHELVAVTEAYACMGREFYDSVLFDTISEQVAVRKGDFTAEQLGALTRAFTAVKHRGTYPPAP